MVIKIALSEIKYLCPEHFTYTINFEEDEHYLVETQNHAHSCEWDIPEEERYCEDPDALKITKAEWYEL